MCKSARGTKRTAAKAGKQTEKRLNGPQNIQIFENSFFEH